ncbi:uncharacterized protein [Periplaneta americana]|uniref:uncharacterized protein n=1 Tax=Periplaneta americana TaxID=6978 RepID=UPI0037E7A40C
MQIDVNQQKQKSDRYRAHTLGILRLLQMLLCLACTVVHVLSYAGQPNPFPHVTLFCGSFCGSFLLCTAMFFAYTTGVEVPFLVDAVCSLLSGLLLSTCGIVAMVFVQTSAYSQHSSSHPLHVDYTFFHFARAQSVLSTVTALCFWIDFFLVSEIWLYLRRPPRDPIRAPGIFIERDEAPFFRLVCLDVYRWLCRCHWRMPRRIWWSVGMSDLEFDTEEFVRLYYEEQTRRNDNVN